MNLRVSPLRVAAPIVVFVWLAACSTGSGSARKLHHLGERVQLGSIVYNVLEAEWHNELGAGPNTRVPKNRFLILRLNITNAGNREVNIPLFQLEDLKGNTTMELQEGDGVEEWLGILRNLGPTETVQGRVIFDIEGADCQLLLSDGGDPDKEKLAYVRIPLKVKESGPLAAPLEGK